MLYFVFVFPKTAETKSFRTRFLIQSAVFTKNSILKLEKKAPKIPRIELRGLNKHQERGS